MFKITFLQLILLLTLIFLLFGDINKLKFQIIYFIKIIKNFFK